MKLKKLIVKNFRNYKDVTIDLSNKNVVFGMNDVGKTNLLWSLRYLLDRKIRANGFQESDFFQRDTEKDIEITLAIDVSDIKESNDSQHIISRVRGARNSRELNLFYFKVIAKYDDRESFGIPELYWGNNVNELEKIPQKGNFSDLDKLFNVVYIDPTIDLETIFLKNKKRIFEKKDMVENDIKIKGEIDELTTEVNTKISSMEVIREFQNKLTDEYRQLKDEDIGISLQSEMAIKGFFSDITPYIRKESESALYPTSGDGRRKILSYSLLNYLNKEYDSDRISIYLIEEPENSLHRSMQIALSKQLFMNSIYEYFILSTHSSELLYEMDNASLIRIHSKDKTVCESYIYEVPDQFVTAKKELNEHLTTALFTDTVLLIEGPSEKVLFEKVLSEVKPTYELNGSYILVVDGIKFKPYFDVLTHLKITTIIKTDNDLKAKSDNKKNFDLIGFNRCCDIINHPKLDAIEIDYSSLDENSKEQWLVSNKKEKMFDNKKRLYDENFELVQKLKESNIFISKVDLENDLYEAIPNKLSEVFGNNPVKKMQDKKLLNMLKLVDELSTEDCWTIYNHSKFESLKKLVE